MRHGKESANWWFGQGQARCWLGPCLCLLAGCVTSLSSVEQAIISDPGIAERSQKVSASYRAACPDVLEVGMDGRPDLGGRLPIGPDGRVGLGSYGRLRVEGQTTKQIADRITDVVPASGRVQVRVADFNSQQVFVFGQVNGAQRAVPYHGQETVVDLLHRAGGITPGAEPNDIYLVRSHVIDGQRPEVFPIKLKAIVANQDQRTNLHVQPFDQIYIGETRQSGMLKCIPPILRPLYERIWGIKAPNPLAENPTTPTTRDRLDGQGGTSP